MICIKKQISIRKAMTTLFYILLPSVILSSQGILLDITRASDIEASVNIDASLNLSLSANVLDLNLNPAQNNFGSTTISISTSTNNPTGYRIMMTPQNSDLINPQNSSLVIHTLDPSSEKYDENNFTDNRWGYKLHNSTDGFKPVFPISTIVDSANNPVSASISSIDFAAKVNYEQASGVYNTSITFEAIANPPLYDGTFEDAFTKHGKTPINYNGAHYYKMQDINSAICNAVSLPSSTSENDTKSIQLIDTRDNTVYWVSKLLDGHCWMTQNLDFNLNQNVALTSEDTDLNEFGVEPYIEGYSQVNGLITYVPNHSTSGYSGKQTLNWRESNTEPSSSDPGIWFEDGAYFESIGCNYLVSECVHFSRLPYTSNGFHGSVGNYYNFSAAIASNNSSSLVSSTADDISQNPKNSICPAGWRLPTISANYASPEDEYSRLYSLYKTSDAQLDKGLFNAPLYFVRSSNSYTRIDENPGYHAYYLSSTVSSVEREYVMYFSSSYIDTRNNYTDILRRIGRSARCVAR